MDQSIPVIPKGFPRLYRQNQASLVQLIDCILVCQEKKWHGSVELHLAPGSLITQIQLHPAALDVKKLLAE